MKTADNVMTLGPNASGAEVATAAFTMALNARVRARAIDDDEADMIYDAFREVFMNIIAGRDTEIAPDGSIYSVLSQKGPSK